MGGVIAAHRLARLLYGFLFSFGIAGLPPDGACAQGQPSAGKAASAQASVKTGAKVSAKAQTTTPGKAGARGTAKGAAAAKGRAAVPVKTVGGGKAASAHATLSHAKAATVVAVPTRAGAPNAMAANATPTTTPPPADNAALCGRLSARLPGVSRADCEAAGLRPSGGLSRNGVPILAREIPPAAGAKAPLRVLLLGGIHGDELTASAIVFQWMQWMSRPIAGSFHWRVAPIVNPDGLLAPRPTRVNAGGVDINRNFPTPGWHQDAPKYWSKVTGSDPRRFPGKNPLSEPESRWVNDEIARFRPDVIISVHAPFGVLDFDGPAPVPQRFGLLRFNRVGVYPGSLGNYLGLYKNTPVITLELPNAQAMPPQVEVQRIWADMLTWIRQNVNQETAARAAPRATRS